MLENPFFWIVLVIVVTVAVPVIAHLIRKKDFKDQVSGKKAERELKKDPAAFSNEKQKASQEIEMLKLEIQQKTKDNLMGLK